MALRVMFCYGRRSCSRRAKLFILLLLGGTVLCGVFTAVFLIAGVRHFNIGQALDDAAQGKDGVALLGHAYDIDVVARQVQMSWLVLGCGTLAIYTGSYGSNSCGRPNLAVDFFVDGASNATGSYDPAANLWYDVETADDFYIQATVEIQTEHLLDVTAWYGQDQQYAYPFDTYLLETLVLARASDTNISVPVLFLRIADATSNFQPFLNKDANVRTLSINGSPIETAHAVQYSFHRVPLSQLFVMVLFVVNWLLTMVVVYIAVSAYEGLPMSEGVLVLPVSVILTIPALRALWVDAPAFGLLLDLCGTFLQMVIVSLASLYLVVNVGLRRKETALKRRRTERNHEQDRIDKSETATASQTDLEKEAALPLLHQTPS